MELAPIAMKMKIANEVPILNQQERTIIINIYMKNILQKYQTSRNNPKKM
jgi:hypothetical protein